MNNKLLQIRADSKSNGWEWDTWILSDQDEKALLKGYRPSIVKADKVCRFFEQFLKHSKGDYAGKPFILLPWQLKFLRPLYGWVDQYGLRRYKRAGVWIGKKNGKTETASGLTLFHLVADGEKGAQCYSAAADKKQAGLVFIEAANMVTHSPALQTVLKTTKTTKTISYAENKSFYRTLSSEVKGADGLDISFLIFDELHTQPNRHLFDALRYGTSARSQPLFITISTAGSDLGSIAYEQYQKAKGVIDGTHDDIRFLPVIYETPKELDWGLESSWRLSNPALGEIIDIDDFRAEWEEANSIPSMANSFLRLRLNQWTQSRDKWLDPFKWKECYSPIPLSDWEGKDCYGGLDLAAHLDFTAFTLIFRKDGEFWTYHWFWLPSEQSIKRNKSDDTPVEMWKNQGFLTITEGTMTDYDVIKDKILELKKRFNIKTIARDRYMGNELTQALQKKGLTFADIPQGPITFNSPSRRFDGLILENKIHHNDNPVMNWMIGNVSTRTDKKENIMPCKPPGELNKIDGITTTVMALSQWILQGPEKYRPYKKKQQVWIK